MDNLLINKLSSRLNLCKLNF